MTQESTFDTLFIFHEALKSIANSDKSVKSETLIQQAKDAIAQANKTIEEVK